jgi:SAM-dependent methyltransferase
VEQKSIHPDLYGQALYDFITDNDPQDIVVHSDVTETEIYPVEVFFRNYAAFPYLEQQAMKLCKGKILDVGAGAGIHARHLQELGFDVYPIDSSPKAVDVMKKMNVEKARKLDFFAMGREKYDTILMMMNGFGIMGEVNRLDEFFIQAKKLLYPGGQILCDSSDLMHLYADDDGTISINLADNYYGQVTYQMEYKNQFGEPFKWLFLDQNILSDYAQKHGFKVHIVFENEVFHYLAQLVLEE